MKKSLSIVALSLTIFSGCGSDEAKKEPVQIQSVATPASIATEITKPTQPTSTGEGVFKTKCASCHGSDAMGRADFPKLAGQSKADLEKKLTGYKNGTFGNKMKAVMEPNAKALSSNQIEDIAGYIAGLK